MCRFGGEVKPGIFSGKWGVNFKIDLYRAIGSGFNCNLDIARYFHQITNHLLVYKRNQLE